MWRHLHFKLGMAPAPVVDVIYDKKLEFYYYFSFACISTLVLELGVFAFPPIASREAKIKAEGMGVVLNMEGWNLGKREEVAS